MSVGLTLIVVGGIGGALYLFVTTQAFLRRMKKSNLWRVPGWMAAEDVRQRREQVVLRLFTALLVVGGVLMLLGE